MYTVDNDMTISITRGDTAILLVTAETDSGEQYKFQPGDVIRFKVFEKKACENVVLQKDFGIEEATETVEILLTEQDTKIGEIISKPVTYWYEVELNPDTNPQTIIGYDEDGAKIFTLMPEGKDKVSDEENPNNEDLGTLDDELSLTSEKAVKNRVIARAIIALKTTIEEYWEKFTEGLEEVKAKIKAEINQRSKAEERIDTELAVIRARITALSTLEEGSTTGDAELADIRAGADGKTYDSAGEAVRGQFKSLKEDVANAMGTVTFIKDITDTLSVINGWYHKDTGVLNSQTNAQGTEIFQVAAGEKYYITGVYGYYACLIAEYDETQTFIQPILTAESNTIATDYEYIVPEGVSYIACSSRYVSISELVVKKEVTEYTNVIALKEELEAKIENTNEGVAENAADIEEIKSLITHAKNLYNPENDVYAQRAELNTSTGTLGMGSDYNVRNSEWIKVEPLTTYFLSHCNSTSVTVYCAEKDADDNIVTTYVFLNITSENGEGLGQVFTTQETTSYFKFSVYTNAQNDYISSFMLEEHHVGTSYEKYKEILNYKEYLPMAMQNQWKGKHLVVDGDSITHSFKDSETNRHFYWQFVVTELLDMWLEVSRKSPSENSSSGYAGCGWRGIGGSTIANEAGCNDEDVSIVLRYQNYPDDADLLIIAGGSNDWAHGKTLIGDFDSMDDTTFNGALNILLPALKEKYPTIPIIMMTPIKRGTHGATVTVKDAEGNDVLQTQEQFVNALIAKCRQYGVHCLDMWSVCRLDPTVDSMVKAYYTRLASDGVSNDLVHPDKAGQEVMGKTVAGFLKSIIP